MNRTRHLLCLCTVSPSQTSVSVPRAHCAEYCNLLVCLPVYLVNPISPEKQGELYNIDKRHQNSVEGVWRRQGTSQYHTTFI